MFKFGAFELKWLAVPLGAGLTVLTTLELLKPLWKYAGRASRRNAENAAQKP